MLSRIRVNGDQNAPIDSNNKAWAYLICLLYTENRHSQCEICVSMHKILLQSGFEKTNLTGNFIETWKSYARVKLHRSGKITCHVYFRLENLGKLGKGGLWCTMCSHRPMGGCLGEVLIPIPYWMYSFYCVRFQAGRIITDAIETKPFPRKKNVNNKISNTEIP